MLDPPLTLLLSGLAALAFRRRGDRPLAAVGKGLLVGYGAIAVLGVVLAVTVGHRSSRSGSGSA